MPSTITHAYLGIDTLSKLNDKPRDIIEKRIGNFKVYCQGMDVLYFYHLLLLKSNKIQLLGHEFHNRDVFNSFNTLVTDNKENKDTELFTLIAGMIVHYQADSIMHPYIDYLSIKSNEAKIDKHFEIETYLDNYYIRKNNNVDYKKYNFSKFFFNYTKSEIVEEEISKLFKLYFNYQNMGRRYYQALSEMKFVYRFIRLDRFGLKKGIYKMIDYNPFHIRRVKYLSYHFNLNNDNYYLNLDNSKWFNYDDKSIVSCKSFLELYDEVIEKASYIINELYKYIFENKDIDLYKLIGNNSYANGLPAQA